VCKGFRAPQAAGTNWPAATGTMPSGDALPGELVGANNRRSARLSVCNNRRKDSECGTERGLVFANHWIICERQKGSSISASLEWLLALSLWGKSDPRLAPQRTGANLGSRLRRSFVVQGEAQILPVEGAR
jgi:hypothetical protein